MGVSNPLGQALQQLWIKFLPQMEERVAVLESAARALGAGNLSDEERTAAAAAAHKLAGGLGTFGLAEGTNLAREAEQLYASGAPLDAADAARLGAIAQQLAEMVRTHS